MMHEKVLVLIALIGAASYFQTITGFGLSMIVMGATSGFDLAPVASIATLLSLVTLTNSATALHGKLHHIDWRAVCATTLGALPAVVVGVLLLDYMSASASSVLQLLLGAVVLYGGLSSALRPAPLAQRSGDRSFFVSGVCGGLLSGMFGLSGPPLIFQFYRQPLKLIEIRCALILIFAFTALTRVMFNVYQGQLGVPICIEAAIATPVVMLMTIAARHYPPPLSSISTRRLAFGVLMAIGASLVLCAIRALIGGPVPPGM